MRENGFLVFLSNSEKEEKMCFIFFCHIVRKFDGWVRKNSL